MERASYRELAEWYDLVYARKQYAREARILHRLAERSGRSGGHRLLDVGCGTGEHLRFLRAWYEVTGVDASPEMLRVARRKLPGIPFRRGDMRDFVVPGRFDVLTCLFSAIGYLEDDAALSATFARFFAALRPGGVALIEPWLRPVDWRPGGVHLLEAGDRERSVARMNASDRDGEFSIMVMHYLVGDRRGVRHFVEHHRMRLVPHGHLLQLLRRAGFHPRLERSVMPLGRGLLVAVRPAEPPARRSGGSGRRTKP